MLSVRLLETLRHWWRTARPQHWLFPGTSEDIPITRQAVSKACQRAAAQSGISWIRIRGPEMPKRFFHPSITEPQSRWIVGSRKWRTCFAATAQPIVKSSARYCPRRDAVVMRSIESCRTAVLGGHVEVCNRCGQQRVWYTSCLMGSISLWGVGRLNDAGSNGRTCVQLTIKIWRTLPSEAQSVCPAAGMNLSGGAAEQQPQWPRVFRLDQPECRFR